MSAINDDIETSQYAKMLKEECMKTIPKRRGIEILLLIIFAIVFTIMVVYLWINVLIYDFWFYIMIGVVFLIVVAGYLMDRRYRVDWKYYFLEILKERHGIDTIRLSDYINDGQPLLGANLGNCEKFLKIAEKFIKEGIINIVIRGATVYLKGYEPPPEEKEESESDESKT